MACNLSTGFTIDCGRVVGGLKSVFISQAAAIDQVSGADFAVAADLVTTITAQCFYEFQLKRELSSLTVTQNHDAASGTTMVEQSLSCVFLGQSATEYADLADIAYGHRLVIVQTDNNVLYLLGAENGMEVTSFTNETGTSYGDFVGYRLEMTGREKINYFATPLADWPVAGGASIITGTTGASICT
jgi:hypothetical protein